MTNLFAALCILFGAEDPARPEINPFPRQRLADEILVKWKFDRGAEGWSAQHHCELAVAEGVLKVRNTGFDPFFHRPLQVPGGELVLRLRARARATGMGEIFWTTDRSPNRGPDKSRGFALIHDGQWHEYGVEFSAPGTLTDLRIDPGMDAGLVEIEWIRLARRRWHPLSIEKVEVSSQTARFLVKNHEEAALRFTALGRPHTIAGGATLAIERPIPGKSPLEAVRVDLAIPSDETARPDLRQLKPVERTVFVFHPEVDGDFVEVPANGFVLDVARDGSVARVRRNGRVVAALAPLAHRDGRLPALKLASEKPALRFVGEGVSLEISVRDREIDLAIASEAECEGPVVRAFGALKQGLLSGVEYLGAGEASSSKLDIETEEHIRFAPDPLHVTMPLMSFVTDAATVSMVWQDMALQPIYATPNFFDGTPDHRMALRGKKIAATIRIDDVPVEEAIAWAVGKHGLPPLPPAPRTPEQQWEICLKALHGPLKTEAGWGHCAEPNWGRAPYADMASTIWRLTGKIPDLSKLVPGGAHVENPSIYFVTGRAAEWKENRHGLAQAQIRAQKLDGSYRYNGPFRRGHFEDTASGICAHPARLMLEYAWITGDQEALAAGCRTLDYMKRFDVPRGAQTWEVPLHTPDQLASANAVWAYVRGYQLTGKKEYLSEARRWALSGIPFTYLWSRYPIMLYSTPPVFGATHWRHNWIGLPVQWVGGVYAYALTILAPHDRSLDWNHLARGILISAEQQQYPDGEWIGLLPDSFALKSQTRIPARINPCAIVSLRLVLDGQVDSLAVAVEGNHRVAAPFPVTLRDGKAHIQSPKGLGYEILVNGRVVQVPAQADGVVPLDQ